MKQAIKNASNSPFIYTEIKCSLEEYQTDSIINKQPNASLTIECWKTSEYRPFPFYKHISKIINIGDK